MTKYKILMITSSFPYFSQTFILDEIQYLKQYFDLKILRIKNDPLPNMHWKNAEDLKRIVIFPCLLNLFVQFLLKLLCCPIQSSCILFYILLNHKGLTGKLKALWIFILVTGSLRQIEAFNPDFVYAHFANYPALAAYVIHMWTSIPFGYNCHGTDIQRDKQMLEQKLEHAGFVTTISEYNKRVYIDQLHDKSLAAKLYVFYLGTHPQKLIAEKKEEGLLLGVGRLSEEKNWETMIRAMKSVDKEAYHKLEIIGDGPLFNKLQYLISTCGLDKKVILVGKKEHSEVLARLKIADIFVLPSIREGLPVSIMEAMAAETICVASDITGIPELIDDRNNGVLIQDPFSEDSICQAIKTALVSDESLRKNARNKVLLAFDFQKNVELKRNFFEKYFGKSLSSKYFRGK